MSNYNDLVTILKELLFNRFYPKPEYIRGLLGDGQGNVLVPERPDYNYVRFSRSSTETFEVFNKEVSQPVDGWPVLIGTFPWAPGLVQVVATDWSAYAQTGWGDNVASIQAHAPTHEWPNFAPGSDMMNVFMRAIVPMRTQAAGSGSTSVIVTTYEYDGATGTNYNWPGLPPLNLQPATPPTGSMRYMGVYLNPMTNTLGVVTGSTTIYTDAAEPARPVWPRLVMPSAYVRLYGGQAAITERDIRDARRLWEHTLIYTGSMGPHNLLSQFHPDTLTASVVAGDLIYGSSTPKWTRLPIVTGSYLGSQAGTPAWTNVTQLAAPDGNPNPALRIDNAGDAFFVGNASLPTTAKDVFIAGDEAGTKARTVDMFHTSITDHFDSSVLDAAWSWASYTGFVTPGGIELTTPSMLKAYLTGAQSATSRAFAYRSAYNGLITSRCQPLLNVRTGVRLDDGTNSNYVELFLEYASGLMSLRYRYAQSGIVTGPLDIFTDQLIQFLVLRIFEATTTVKAVAYQVDGVDVTNVVSLTLTAVSYTRSGIYYEQISGAVASARAGIWDWYKQG